MKSFSSRHNTYEFICSTERKRMAAESETQNRLATTERTCKNYLGTAEKAENGFRCFQRLSVVAKRFLLFVSEGCFCFQQRADSFSSRHNVIFNNLMTFRN